MFAHCKRFHRCGCIVYLTLVWFHDMNVSHYSADTTWRYNMIWLFAELVMRVTHYAPSHLQGVHCLAFHWQYSTPFLSWCKKRNSGLEIREYGRGDPLRWPRHTLYPQKLALTSPTSGGRSVGIVRSRTKATEFVLFCKTMNSFKERSLPRLSTMCTRPCKVDTVCDRSRLLQACRTITEVLLTLQIHSFLPCPFLDEERMQFKNLA
jgi:hypothetical protein